jgi:hypothetical protein
MVDGALEFDGVDDYVTSPNVLGFMNPRESLAIFAWVKGGGPHQVIACDSRTYGHFLLQVDFTGNLLTTLYCRMNEYLFSETQITDGEWHHVGLVWEANIATNSLYVDGAEVARNIPTSDLSQTRELQGLNVGTSWGLNSGDFWSGLIDDVRIYNRAVRSFQQQTFSIPEF